MESKPILHNNGSLDILIDAKNLGLNFDSNPMVRRLLAFSKNDHFQFLRTPYNTTIQEIDEIPHFDNEIDNEHNMGGIEFIRDGKWSGSHAVTPVLSNVESIGTEIFHKAKLTDEEWEKIWYVFVHHSLVEHESIFDTVHS